MFFNPNTSLEVKDRLRAILNVTIFEDPGKYLGLPTIWGRSKKMVLAFVKDKILGKIQGWKHGLLSQAGREVLIKSVAQAVLSYPMSVFLFPNGFCKEIDSILANFEWGQSQQSNKIHWISWKDLGMPKNEGGMGFRNLKDFNVALLAKQGWRMVMEPQAFWAQLLKSKYFPNGDFLRAGKGAKSSWAWSSLLWIPRCPEHALQSSHLSHVDLEAKVETIIDCQSREWNLEASGGMFSPNAAKIIRAMPLGDGWEKDRLIWPLNQTDITLSNLAIT
ncbi:unnamed protein product [Prunus armeniaca]